jgi:hypothetical protein
MLIGQPSRSHYAATHKVSHSDSYSTANSHPNNRHAKVGELYGTFHTDSSTTTRPAPFVINQIGEDHLLGHNSV